MTTDSDVIRRSRDSPPAFGELFHRHATVVHRYIARRAGTDVADEVMSETFLVAFERRDRFDHTYSDARPWLFGIATNLLGSYRRREARHLRSLSRAAEPEDDDGGLAGIAARIDATAGLRRIAARIQALPAGDRDVLLLHAWADLSGEQIAAALDIPVGTVRSRLSRARTTLRAAAAETTTSKESDMDELTLLRRLDAETAAPTKAALEEAFEALTARMTDAGQTARHLVDRRRRRVVRLRWAALATAGATALAVTLVLTDLIGVAGIKPGATAAAAELLNRAGRHDHPRHGPDGSSGLVPEGRLHERARDRDRQQGRRHGALHDPRGPDDWIPADVRASWTEVRYPAHSAGQYWGDGAKQVADEADVTWSKARADVLHGKAGAFFGTDPARTPEAINALPHDPRVLLNHIYRVTLGSGTSPDGEALVFIADTLNTGLADAATRAALYRTAALIPGVTLTAHSATLDGHEGVAIGRVEPKTGIRVDLIIDPDTGTLIGEREVATRAIDPFTAGTTFSWSSADTTVVEAVPAEYRQ